MLLAAILALGAANAQAPERDRDRGQDRPAANAPGNFGAGLALGDTTGLTLGYRPNEWNAVNVGLGYDILDRNAKASADYLQSVAVIDPNRRVRIPIYVGLGAGVGRDIGLGGGGGQDDGGRMPVAGEPPGIETGGGAMDLSARVPIGASVLYMDAPVEVFAQAIPSLRIIPDRQLDLDGTVGVRYHW